MVQTRSTEGKNYRERQKEKLGKAAFLAQEAKKRKERRNKNQTEVFAKPKNDNLLELIFKIKTKLANEQPKPKTIKKSSIEAQLRKVRNIHKKLTGNNANSVNNTIDLKWLRDTDKVIKFIQTHDSWKTANSRNSQLQAISSILIAFKHFKKEYLIYSALSVKGRKTIDKTDDDNLLTVREKKNILPWDEIRKKTLEYQGSEKALVSLYVLLPPRRADVGLLTLASNTKELNNDLNYLIDNPVKPMLLIYLKYKTDKTYGRTEIIVPNKLADILRSHIKENKIKSGDPIFGTQKNKYYKSFSSNVSSAFKKVTGKRISINLLRHSFISSYLKKQRSLTERKKIARFMGNSITTQDKYVRIDL